jgi:transcriptional regulator with PAS, ATPase and Fis domain
MRSNGPFVAVNCGAIPSNLIESELFGYVEGAFTGAKKGGKRGLFEIAHEGTIFLDETSEMDNYGQVMLLCVIQEKQIRRVGDDRVIPVNVRIIAATNRNLMTHIENKKFREDLYYRINVLTLSIPPPP